MTDGFNGEETREFFVENGESLRLDVYLTAETEHTRSRIKKLVDAGKVLVNGAECKCGRILKENDVITLVEDAQNDMVLTPKEIPLDILYEDDDVIVVNKQQGLTVHPGAGNTDDTLVSALLWRGTSLSSVNGAYRPGIVHRLDKDTSGVMIVAKNDFSHASLSKQFSDRTVRKLYVAILEGNLRDDKGMLTTFIGRSEKDRKIMAVVKEGRVAITEYRVLKRFKQNCFAEFNLHTGRTHQIRVHAKYLGHPVLGDKVYGSASKRFSSLDGQLLHSQSLTVAHPRSGETMTFTAPLPNKFAAVYDILKKESEAGAV